MSAPVHQIFIPVLDALLVFAVVANLSVGWYTWREHRRNMRRLRHMLESMGDIQTGMPCLIEGHHWHIETFPLQTKVTERMTVLVKCECEVCLTRLDFQVIFGIDYPSGGHAHPWAMIEPTPPPG